MPKEKGGHAFSIELRTKEYLKNIELSNADQKVLVEGFLGKLRGLSIVEGIMLQVEGENGTLRLELKKEELKKLLPKGRISQSLERGNV